MKFLYFSFEIPELFKDSREIAGGAAVQWLSWINGFLLNGHKFGLLTYKGASVYINKKLDFDIIESYDPTLGIKKLRLIYYFFPKLYQAVKRYKPDFIIQSSPNNHILPLLLISKILNIPFIHRIANDIHVDERLRTLVKPKNVILYNLCLRYSDFILVQNSYQLYKLKEKYPKKKIFILPNPYEININELGILPREKREYISWVGNFRKQKNLPALAEIVKNLPKIIFKIAGTEHKNLDQETRNALNKLKQLKNVELMGYLKRSEINLFLSKSIALINTSYYEGFSNTFLEAWSLGVPVISTINVNPDEIISKNRLGIVVDEYIELKNAIEFMISLTEIEYNEMAKNCYNYVKEKHDPKMLAEKFVSFLIDNKR